MYYYSYIIYILPALLISMFAQLMVTRTFNKYKKVYSSRGYSGADVARKILDTNGLHNVRIEQVSKDLSDHYDPKENVVRLSTAVYSSNSVASIGVAAHEVGHAIQYSKNYVPIKLRAAIIPVTRIGSSLSWPLFFIGFILQADVLLTIGIALFTTVLLFQLITLPVEFNASRRAIVTLQNDYYLDGDELKGAKRVLSAAAMTYVAALFMSIMQLLRLLAMTNRRR